MIQIPSTSKIVIDALLMIFLILTFLTKPTDTVVFSLPYPRVNPIVKVIILSTGKRWRTDSHTIWISIGLCIGPHRLRVTKQQLYSAFPPSIDGHGIKFESILWCVINTTSAVANNSLYTNMPWYVLVKSLQNTNCFWAQWLL